jgi:hypothetical protein
MDRKQAEQATAETESLIGRWIAQRRAQYGNNRGRTFAADETCTCVVCGGEFSRKSRMGPKPRACPGRCSWTLSKRRQAGRYQECDDGTNYATCQWCGVEFEPVRRDAKYHSPACRTAAHRASHREPPAATV